MFSDAEILEIIDKRIGADEKLGDQAGGSGHMGFVSYNLDEYKTKMISKDILEITYTYTIFVETEFTYYPDNPPMEYPNTKVIKVSSDKKIISALHSIGKPNTPDILFFPPFCKLFICFEKTFMKYFSEEL